MTERLRLFDALTFSIRVIRWRPVHAAVYVAVIAILYLLYYAWAASDGGTAFYTRYADATLGLAAGRAGDYFAMMGVTLLVSLIAGTLFTAGGYRVLLRENLSPWLPLRLGTDEVRILGLFLIMFAMFLVAMIGAAILLTIVAVALSFALAGGGPTEQGTALVGTIASFGMLAVMIAMLYVFGRIAVSLPKSIAERRFSLGGWTASRGFGLQLLLAHGVLYLVMMVVQFALAPDLLAYTMSGMTGDPALADPAAMVEMMTRPYGDMTMLIAPIQAVFMFLLLGPTAAVVSWAGRQADTAGSATQSGMQD